MRVSPDLPAPVGSGTSPSAASGRRGVDPLVRARVPVRFLLYHMLPGLVSGSVSRWWPPFSVNPGALRTVHTPSAVWGRL